MGRLEILLNDLIGDQVTELGFDKRQDVAIERMLDFNTAMETAKDSSISDRENKNIKRLIWEKNDSGWFYRDKLLTKVLEDDNAHLFGKVFVTTEFFSGANKLSYDLKITGVAELAARKNSSAILSHLYNLFKYKIVDDSNRESLHQCKQQANQETKQVLTTILEPSSLISNDIHVLSR